MTDKSDVALNKNKFIIIIIIKKYNMSAQSTRIVLSTVILAGCDF